MLERLWGPVKPPLDTHQQITIYSVSENRKKRTIKNKRMWDVQIHQKRGFCLSVTKIQICDPDLYTSPRRRRRRIKFVFTVTAARPISKWSLEDEIILDSAECVWSGLPFVLPCPPAFYLLTTAGPISKSAGPDSTIGPFHTNSPRGDIAGHSQFNEWIYMTNYIHDVHQI